MSKSVKPDAVSKPEAIENLHGRLTTLIRNISGKSDIEVTHTLSRPLRLQLLSSGQDPDKQWMRVVEFDEKTKKPTREYIYVPSKIVEVNERVALGKAAHEASHAAISRAEEFIEEMPNDLVGFEALESSLEERPTDQYVRETYPGAGRWVDEARYDGIRELMASKESVASLNAAPLFAQLSSLIVYAPTCPAEFVETLYDAEVVKIYNQIKSNVEKVESTLPLESDDERSRISYARERVRIAQKEIYPLVESLLKQDKQDAEQQELLEQLQSDPNFSVPPELQDLIEQILNDLAEHISREQSSGDSKSEPRKQAEITEDDVSGDPSQDESSDIETTDTPTDTGEDNSTEPVSIRDLPKALRDKLAELLKNISAEKREEIEQLAKEKLQLVEKKIVEEARSAFEEEVQTFKPEEIDMSKMRSVMETAEKQMQERLAARAERTTRFDQVYHEIREQEQELYRSLEEVFYPNVKSKVLLNTAGSTINIPALYRYESTKEANPTGADMRIFERRSTPETKDYALTLLIDLSGSMQNGGKINEAFKATVMLAETLNRIGIKHEIIGFQDELIIFKNADETLNDEIRDRISGAELEVRGSNKGGHNRPDYNDDGPCLQAASDRLEKLPQREKFLVVISDGRPEGRWSTEADLVQAVAQIKNQTQQHLVALGLGSGTEHVQTYYPEAIANIPASELADELSKLIIKLMNNQ